jgi:hypothetical protein
MGIFLTKKVKHLIAYLIAFSSLIIVARLHQRYNIFWDFRTLSIDPLYTKDLVVNEKINIIMPINISRVIKVDGFINFGFILLINILLSIYLQIRKDQKTLIIICLLFFKFLDVFMNYFVFELNGFYFHFIMLQVRNIRQFLEILPILPFSFLFFSRDFTKQSL